VMGIVTEERYRPTFENASESGRMRF